MTIPVTISMCRFLSIAAMDSMYERDIWNYSALRVRLVFTVRMIRKVATSSSGSGSSPVGASQSASSGQASCLTETSSSEDMICRFSVGMGAGGAGGGGMFFLLTFVGGTAFAVYSFLYYVSLGGRKRRKKGETTILTIRSRSETKLETDKGTSGCRSPRKRNSRGNAEFIMVSASFLSESEFPL